MKLPKPPLGWHNEHAPKSLAYKARYWVLYAWYKVRRFAYGVETYLLGDKWDRLPGLFGNHPHRKKRR